MTGIAGNDSHATIALKTATRVTKLNAYYAQEGVEGGLRYLIINNSSKGAVQDIKDNMYGFAKITLIEIREHLCKNAKAVDIAVATNMIKWRNTAIDFEGKVTLKAFFKEVEKIIGKIKDHGIFTSYTSLMAAHLLRMEQQGGKIMRLAVNRGNTMSPTKKTCLRFKQSFTEANRTHCRALKSAADDGKLAA